MAVQVFRTDQELFEIGALTVDQTVWFKGNDAAVSLGYKCPRNAVRDHVDNEDKKTYGALMQDLETQVITSLLIPIFS